MDEFRQQIQDRLEVLQRELEIGEDRLRVLERESLTVQQTTLRISGAIQVLTELLQAAGPELTTDPAPDAPAHAAP